MVDRVKLVADVRSDKGKGHAGRLRREGRTPGILYGSGVEATAVSVDSLELYHALHTPAGLNALIDLEVDGETHLTVARELQRHAVRENVTHLDFLAVGRDQRISLEVPISLLNEEDPKKAGGVVTTVLHTLPITCTPLNTPSSVVIDLAGLEIGDVRRAQDIPLPEGVELDIDPERTVVTINAPAAEEEPETAELDEELEGVEGEAPEGAEADGESSGDEGGDE